MKRQYKCLLLTTSFYLTCFVLSWISVTYANSLMHFEGVKLTNSACNYSGKVIYAKGLVANANDEIGVFIKNDSQELILIGSCVIGNVIPEHYYINIYGDDTTTEELDGATENAELIFIAWLKSENKEYQIPVTQMQYEAYESLTKAEIPPKWNDKVSFGLLNLTIEGKSKVKPEVNFSNNYYQISEDEETIMIEVEADQPVTEDLVVKILLEGTADGNGIDYKLNNECLIEKGKKKSVINILIMDDTKKESNETIVLQIDSTEESNAGDKSSCTIQIIDNDTLPLVIEVGPENPYKTIQAAVDRITETGLIIVKEGTYEENIEIRKPVTIRAENGWEKTFVKAKKTSTSVFSIYSNTVTIEGFTIYGSTSFGKAAIYLSKESKHCYLNNNRCGFDDTHYNYYGIHIDQSSGNMISNNNCLFNKRYGIVLFNSSSNNLLNNVLNNNRDSGIIVSKSMNNQIIGNQIAQNGKYGLYLNRGSSKNVLYANTISKNIKLNIKSREKNLWHSPVVISYNYKNSLYTGFIGNYYSDHKHTDSNRNGITNLFYEISRKEPQDQYPLAYPFDKYSFAIWRLENDYTMNHKYGLFKQPGLNKISSQDSLIWSEETSALEKPISSQDAWTGQISFLSPLEKGDHFLIEIGLLMNGENFISENSKITITGNGEQKFFPFKIKGSDFSISSNNRLAIKLTNNNSKDYEIHTGGSWSYISQYPDHPDLKVIKVGQNGAYRTINSALEASSSGYTIIVEEGRYNENIDINIPITILSENGYMKTIISADNSRDHAFHIQADDVKIEGFTIYGSTGNNKSGICIENGMKNCTISNNRCGYSDEYHNSMGISIGSSINNTIENNICDFNKKYGIYIHSNFENFISNNTCRNNKYYGIYVYSSMYVNLADNVCINNKRQGIYLNTSFCNVLSNNQIKNNNDGLYINKSGKNVIFNNVCDDNLRYGVIVNRTSIKNILFVNQFSNNKKANIYCWSRDIKWFSEKEIQYKFNDKDFHSKLGNFYDDHQSVDNDHNGILEDSYNIPKSKFQDLFPLAGKIDRFQIILPDYYVLTSLNKAKDIKSIDSLKKSILDENLLTLEDDKIIFSSKAVNTEENILKERVSKNNSKLQLTYIPPIGNRIKTLKGLVLNEDKAQSYVAVYLYNNDEWQIRPDDNNPKTIINDDGTWQCDITKKFNDHLSSKIAVYLFDDTIDPPLNSYENDLLNDDRFQMAISSIQIERPPAIVFTQVPAYGNRIKNLEGIAYVDNSDKYYVAVFIFQNGWRLKPDELNSIIEINENGSWVCDITTAHNDHLATKIHAFVMRQTFILPVISDSSQIPLEIIESAVADRVISLE